MQQKEQLALRIRRAVTAGARELNLKASFTEGRRQGDLLIIRLRGKKQQASLLLKHLEEIFFNVDMELLDLKTQASDTLTVVVTEPVSVHDVTAQERRYKLRQLQKQQAQQAQKAAQPYPEEAFGAELDIDIGAEKERVQRPFVKHIN